MREVITTSVCKLCNTTEITVSEGIPIGGIWIDNVRYNHDEICSRCMRVELDALTLRWMKQRGYTEE